MSQSAVALSKHVFSSALKCLYLMSSVRWPSGRLFQIRGPTAPKLTVVRTWHRAHVIRRRPKGSAVAFRDETDVISHDGMMTKIERFD